MRNENGYRFHSHHSKAILTIRTQSATIAESLVSLVLYIYKKWKCVESLTIPGTTLTVENRFANMGTSINFSQRLLFIHHYSQSEGGGNLH